MSIRLVLIQRPNSPVLVVSTVDRDGAIEDDGDAHVGMRLDAEGEDRDADEENGYHSDDLVASARDNDERTEKERKAREVVTPK